MHVAERFAIHLFCGGTVYMTALWLFWIAERKMKWWPRSYGLWTMILPALTSFMLISFREVYDVAQGDWVWKSIFDWLSWSIGIGAAAWAMVRLNARVHLALFQRNQQKWKKSL